jgi:uncharacterized repeat protein (TIGR01451 family)
VAASVVASPEGPPVVAQDDDADDLDFVTVALPPVADTSINEWFPTRNEAGGMLYVRSQDIAATLMRFDLDEIPAPPNVAIAEATLRLYPLSASNATPLTVAACAISRTWTVSETTWLMADATTPWAAPGANAAEDRSLTCTDVITLTEAEEWVELDLTPLVRTWLQNPDANEGVILKSQSGGLVQYMFPSSEYIKEDLRPRLRVVYALVPTPEPTATPTVTPTPVPQVHVNKVGPQGPLQIGTYEVIRYNIVVENRGMSAVSGVVLTDVLPLGIEFISASGGGVVSGDADDETRVVTWAIGALASGGTRNVTLDLGLPTWVKEKGTIVNLARANCSECMVVNEDYWEISVGVPTPTVTPRVWRMHLPTIYSGM